MNRDEARRTSCERATRKPSIAVATSIVFNLAADVALVGWLRMGVVGAAIGTVLAQLGAVAAGVTGAIAGQKRGVPSGPMGLSGRTKRASIAPTRFSSLRIDLARIAARAKRDRDPRPRATPRRARPGASRGVPAPPRVRPTPMAKNQPSPTPGTSAAHPLGMAPP